MSKMQPVPLHTSSDKALPLSSSMIKILVGRDEVEQEFPIHEAVLDARSGWFRKALSWRRARVEQEKDFHHYKKQMRAQIRERGTFSPQTLKQEEEASHKLPEVIEPKNDHQATTPEHKHPEDLRQDITNQQKPSYEQLCVANGWSEKDSRWNWKHYHVERDAFSFPDESASVFSMYQQLIYTGQILELSPHKIDSEEIATFDEMSTLTPTPSQCPDQCDHDYQALSSLYILADNLRDPAAKGAAAKAIVSKCARNCAQLPAGHNCLPSATAIRIIYVQTRQHCTGRQALVDSFAYYGRSVHFEKTRESQSESFPEEFLLDLVGSLMSVRVRPCKDLPADRLESYEENEEIGRLYEGRSLEKLNAAESSDSGLRA